MSQIFLASSALGVSHEGFTRRFTRRNEGTEETKENVKTISLRFLCYFVSSRE